MHGANPVRTSGRAIRGVVQDDSLIVMILAVEAHPPTRTWAQLHWTPEQWALYLSTFSPLKEITT